MQTKKWNDNLLIFGTFLIGTIFFAIFVTTALLAANQPVRAINLPIAIFLSGVTCHFLFRKTFKQTLYTVLIGVFVIIISIFVCQHIYDWSWDGNTYHKTIAALLKYGWNPLRESFYAFADQNFEFLSTATFTWFDAYPKGTEMWGACVYAITQNIEGGKSFNIITIISLFCICKAFLRETGLFHRWQETICAALCVLTPISIQQALTYLNDAFLWNILLLCFLGLIYLTFYRDGHYRNLSWYYVFISINIGFNTKFSALIFFAALCLAFFLFWVEEWWKCRAQREEKKSFVIKSFWIFSGSVFSGIFLNGATSYVMNTIRYKNPLYTMIGENAANFITPLLAVAYRDMGNFPRFVASLFARTSNSMSTEQIQWKIPFTFNASEVTQAQKYDIRAGGWGILFSGIFLISIFILLLGMYQYRRKHPRAVKLSLYGLLWMLLLIFVVPGLCWARYYCVLFFLPVGALLYLMSCINKGGPGVAKASFAAGGLTVLMCLNMSPIISRTLQLPEEYTTIRTQLEVFRGMTEYNDIVVGFNTGRDYQFYGRIFNLYDLGITRMTFDVVKSQDAAGTLFLSRGLNYAAISGPMSIQNAEEYLEYIGQRDGILALLSVKDEGSRALTGEFCERMRDLGFQFDMVDRYRYSYMAVLDGDTVLYEELSDQKITYETTVDGLDISMTSAGYKTGNEASIQVNGLEFSQQERGINIVLIDKATGRLIDSVSIDTYSDNKLSR